MSSTSEFASAHVELPKTHLSPPPSPLSDHHRDSVSMLYGSESGSSFCPDTSNIDIMLNDSSFVSDKSSQSNRKNTRGTTLSLMANHDVLQGRVDLINKARENSINTRNSDGAEDFTFDPKMSQAERETPRCCCCISIISPLSISHTLWDLFIAVVLIVSLISLPVGMAFDEVGRNMFYMNIAIDFFFISDICVTFCTAFIDENDSLVMEPHTIAKNYLKTWFGLDVIASVPMDFILDIVEKHQTGNTDLTQAELASLTKLFKMVRLVRMLKLVRLFRLSRVAKYIRSLRMWLQHRLMCSIPQAVLQISKLVVVLVIVAHWLGCTFFMISKQFDHPYNSWVVQSGLIDKSTGEQYVWSLLKALYMIIGGEEMLPSGNGIGCNDVEEYCAVESWMSIFALYIGVVFSALLISEVSVIVTSLDRSRQLYHDKVKEANEYMRANKLSPKLREHVREYFAIRYSDQKMFHEQNILEDLSPNLRTQIREEVSSNMVARVPLLHQNDQNHAFIDAVVTQLKGPLICFVKEIIFYENTTAHEMYFIYSGVVGIFNKSTATDVDDVEGVHVAAISNGCYFGEVSLLLGERRTATARSEVITVLHTLDKQALVECLEDVPDIKEYMMQIAQRRKQRIKQIDPLYSGVVDRRFESKKYVDEEDAKTSMFMYDSAVNRRKEASDRRRSRKTRPTSTTKFALHFSKKKEHGKQQKNALQRLRRASMQAVSLKAEKREKRRSSSGNASVNSPSSSRMTSESGWKSGDDASVTSSPVRSPRVESKNVGHVGREFRLNREDEDEAEDEAEAEDEGETREQGETENDEKEEIVKKNLKLSDLLK